MDIYFDNAATTFPKPQCVVDAVATCTKEWAVNTGRGIYPLAQKAERVVLETRQYIAALLNYKQGQVIFSSSATLALNQVLLGLEWTKGNFIYVTPFEHNAVARSIENLVKTFGIEVVELPVNKHSLEFNLDKIGKAFFKKPPTAIVLNHVSNVCGLITPVFEIAQLGKRYEAKVIVDGAQGGPLLPLGEYEKLIDFYVFSGHKTFYGPFGIAGFITNGQINLKPILFGGTGSQSELLSMPEELPFKLEIGSLNIVAISGLNASCQWLTEQGIEKIVFHERELMSYAIEGLSQFTQVKTFVSQNITNHLGILSFVVEGFTVQEVGMILSQQYGIAARTGLHCAPLAHKFLGTFPKGTIRLGFGFFNTKNEVQCFINAIEKIVE